MWTPFDDKGRPIPQIVTEEVTPTATITTTLPEMRVGRVDHNHAQHVEEKVWVFECVPCQDHMRAYLDAHPGFVPQYTDDRPNCRACLGENR